MGPSGQVDSGISLHFPPQFFLLGRYRTLYSPSPCKSASAGKHKRAVSQGISRVASLQNRHRTTPSPRIRDGRPQTHPGRRRRCGCWPAGRSAHPAISNWLHCWERRERVGERAPRRERVSEEGGVWGAPNWGSEARLQH